MRTALACLLTLVSLAAPLAAQTIAPISEWRYWQRDANPVAAMAQTRDGRSAIHIQHAGKQDWSLQPAGEIAAKPGELLELSVDVLIEGEGDVTPAFTTLSEPEKVVNWVAGSRPVRSGGGWKTLRARILVDESIALVRPRVIGNGPARVWVANPRLSRRAMNVANNFVACETPMLRVTFNTGRVAFAFTDRRTGRTWEQKLPVRQLLVAGATGEGNEISAKLLMLEEDVPMDLKVRIEPDRPEVLFTLSAASDAVFSTIGFPGAIATEAGQHVVFPMNEGISFPADDPAMPTYDQIAYGGHGICMPWFGVTDGNAGWMAILQTADDAALRLTRHEGLNLASPAWQPQRGTFGYAREVRYVFFTEGGHVAMAKRYRQYAKDTGLLVTFSEKVKQRPAIDKLLGAVNIWCWDQDAASYVAEMQKLGIDRILWSNKLAPEQLKKLNDMGVLTSRYDIYQDLMDPANFPRLRYTHPDWTTEGFPKDIILDRNGKPISGWGIEPKEGGPLIPCAVLCDLRAPEYARRRIGEELKTHPYAARFIDTTTASPWRECYHPDHPMTRTQSKVAKMELLSVVSKDFDLVCGSETGHDAAVPHCDFFEGMLSLGPYRVDDSGRNMQRIVMEVPEKLSKFQVGEKYRLPLWELVYHDACVAQWYWGDYNNKLPAIWDKRDLFNALYGTPPMFMFNRKLWEENKDRFVKSYKASAAITRATAYQEMTDHRFLTPDRLVQQTTFANGVKVTVNFGEQAYTSKDAKKMEPHSVAVDGIGNDQ